MQVIAMLVAAQTQTTTSMPLHSTKENQNASNINRRATDDVLMISSTID